MELDATPVRIIDSVLIEEYAENKVWKDFVQSERVEIAKSVEVRKGQVHSLITKV